MAESPVVVVAAAAGREWKRPAGAGAHAELICYIHGMTKQLSPKHDDAKKPDLSYNTHEYWNLTRGQCLGAAGAALAVALVVTQLFNANPGMARWLALACSAIAVPVWLAVWGICEAYVVVDKPVLAHAEKSGSIVLTGVLMSTGALLLFAAIIALLSIFSLVIAVLFFCTTAVLLPIVMRHHSSVDSYQNALSGMPNRHE